jgi:hypothetical protein
MDEAEIERLVSESALEVTPMYQPPGAAS